MKTLTQKTSGASAVIGIRVAAEDAALYRRLAGKSRLSLSAFLGKLLAQGVVVNTVADIEERLRFSLPLSAAAAPNTSPAPGSLHDDLSEAILLCRELLVLIVEAQDVQSLYAAQDRVKARLKTVKGAGHGRA